MDIYTSQREFGFSDGRFPEGLIVRGAKLTVEEDEAIYLTHTYPTLFSQTPFESIEETEYDPDGPMQPEEPEAVPDAPITPEPATPELDDEE